jgi:hypothetical protein
MEMRPCRRHAFIPLVALLFLANVLGGCALYSNGTFEAYSGANEFTGQGGTKRTVDGIDIWDSGLPPRRCRLLGFIYQQNVADQSVLSVVANMDTEHEIIKEAKKVGGDAVAIGPWNTSTVGYSGNVDAYGNFGATATTVSNNRIAVLKYLPQK